MFVVTITERTPTPPEDKDTNIYTVRKDSMFEVADFLKEQELNWTCWVHVSITFIKED